MQHIIVSTSFFLLLLFTGLPVAAQSYYVSDQLIVTVRSNTSNNHEVLVRLASNTPVTVLGEQGNFYRIRTPGGVEGFTLKTYITDEAPKGVLIEQLQTELDSLRKTYGEQQQQLQVFDDMGIDRNRLSELTNELEISRSELQQMTERYATLREDTSDVLQLAEEKQYLEEQNQMLNQELTILREENRNFHRSNMIQWFFAGAGVFLGGWLIGKISRQKQRGFSRL